MRTHATSRAQLANVAANNYHTMHTFTSEHYGCVFYERLTRTTRLQKCDSTSANGTLRCSCSSSPGTHWGQRTSRSPLSTGRLYPLPVEVCHMIGKHVDVYQYVPVLHVLSAPSPRLCTHLASDMSCWKRPPRTLPCAKQRHNWPSAVQTYGQPSVPERCTRIHTHASSRTLRAHE